MTRYDKETVKTRPGVTGFNCIYTFLSAILYGTFIIVINYVKSEI